MERIKQMLQPIAELGPVFPILANDFGVVVHGMTKRELFAAMFMQSTLSKSSWIHINGKEKAKDCVEMADILLKELEK